MQMIPVNSSNLRAVGYEDGRLYVEFHSGSLYYYDNVPEAVYHALMNASSHGKYFSANIRDVYRYHRVR